MAFNISPFYNHEPGHINSKKVRESRGGNTTYVTGKQGNYSFYDSPQYDDHQPSSHLMADDNKKGAWPSIYRDSLSGKWSNQNRNQAIERNELYNFNTNEDMTNFARVGNWKKSSPVNKGAKGGGTTKACLPKSKIASMSPEAKQKVINAKKSAGSKGKRVRSSKSNVTGTSANSLEDWVKQDWRQVANPSKKCGEK